MNLIDALLCDWRGRPTHPEARASAWAPDVSPQVQMQMVKFFRWADRRELTPYFPQYSDQREYIRASIPRHNLQEWVSMFFIEGATDE